MVRTVKLSCEKMPPPPPPRKGILLDKCHNLKPLRSRNHAVSALHAIARWWGAITPVRGRRVGVVDPWRLQREEEKIFPSGLGLIWRSKPGRDTCEHGKEIFVKFPGIPEQGIEETKSPRTRSVSAYVINVVHEVYAQPDF